MPLTAYGWSPLRALTAERYRFIDGPRPEIYDLQADPARAATSPTRHPPRRAACRRGSPDSSAAWKVVEASAAPRDAELTARSRASATSGAVPPAVLGDRPLQRAAGSIPRMDCRCSRASRTPSAACSTARRAPRRRSSRTWCAPVPERSLPHPPGRGATRGGQPERALAALGEAIRLNPRLEFLHQELAATYAALERLAEAEKAYRVALQLNPRLAPAWIGLAQTLRKSRVSTPPARRSPKARAPGRRAARCGSSSASWISMPAISPPPARTWRKR